MFSHLKQAKVYKLTGKCLICVTSMSPLNENL